jgi:ankyrin repeat protein
MHWSAFHGRNKVMKYLLTSGADPRAQDKEGRTPLHLSTGSESAKCTKQLLRYLDRDAVNDADVEHMTAAHWCAYHDHSKHLELLIELVGASAVVLCQG